MNKKKQEKKERNKKDKIWKEEVIKSYGMKEKKCVICGNKKMVNIHHIIPKEIKEFRWDIENGVPLCPKCHKFGMLSAHKNPLWFMNWLNDVYPDRYCSLLAKINEWEVKNGKR